MDSINIRYGEAVTLPLDTGDITATAADLYIGRPGEPYTLTQGIPLVNGKGVFELAESDTQMPLGTYYYQINIHDANNAIEKYPSPAGDCDGCDSDFPKFVVFEALDETEVV